MRVSCGMLRPALAMGGRDVGERAIDAMISTLEKDRRERARFERIWPVLRESFAAFVPWTPALDSLRPGRWRFTLRTDVV